MQNVSVRITKEVIPTYLPAPPDRHPMFLEKRVYQGSSGKVYPLPFTDRIAESKTDHAWKAIWLENEYLRVMVLPEIGGRIHVAQDKTNGYDFIYRQTVIKPALVGLAGRGFPAASSSTGRSTTGRPRFCRLNMPLRNTPTARKPSGSAITIRCRE